MIKKKHNRLEHWLKKEDAHLSRPLHIRLKEDGTHDVDDEHEKAVDDDKEEDETMPVGMYADLLAFLKKYAPSKESLMGKLEKGFGDDDET